MINLGGFGDVIHGNDDKTETGIRRLSWDTGKEAKLQDTTKGQNKNSGLLYKRSQHNLK